MAAKSPHGLFTYCVFLFDKTFMSPVAVIRQFYYQFPAKEDISLEIDTIELFFFIFDINVIFNFAHLIIWHDIFRQGYNVDHLVPRRVPVSWDIPSFILGYRVQYSTELITVCTLLSWVNVPLTEDTWWSNFFVSSLNFMSIDFILKKKNKWHN